MYFEPIVDASTSPDATFRLFDDLGWSLQQILGPNSGRFISDVRAVATGVGSIRGWEANPPVTLAELPTALATVADTVTALADLPTALGGVAPTEVADLPEQLLGWLAARYVGRRSPTLFWLLVLLTLVDELPAEKVVRDGRVVRRALTRPVLRLDRLTDLLRDPTGTLRTEYKLGNLDTRGDAAAAGAALFTPLAELLKALRFTAIVGRGVSPKQLGPADEQALAGAFTSSRRFVDGNVTVELGTTLKLIAKDSNGPGVLFAPFGEVDVEHAFDAWYLEARVAGDVGGFAITGKGVEIASNIDAPSVDASFVVARVQPTHGQPFALGSATETRLEIGEFAIRTGGTFEAARQDYGFDVEIGSAALVVSAGNGDGFLQKVLPPEGLRTEFDLGIGWSKLKGLHFKGAAALEATLPVQADLLGALRVNSVYLSLRAVDEKVAASVGATVTVTLGPVTAVVERMGLRADLSFPAAGGNLGPAHLDLDFKPPSGAAIRVDAGVAVGGGYLFFDPEAEQYAGVLQLELGGKVSVKAIGLLTTRMPDGSAGFSLLLVITAEGFASIPLGFGFTLEGIGGLIGVNRTVNVDVLRAGIKTGALDSILFPSDPVRNAPSLVSTLGAVMPPASGRFLVGPMAILGWGTPTILTLKLAILVELPDPVRLAVLGRLSAHLPSVDTPVVRLQMDAIGLVDFDRGEVALDAALFDSRLLGYVLTGDMALRARWGADPTFVLSVGGLNPRFPVPAGFPRLDRLALSLAESDTFRLRLAAYLALTSNSVQFGARADLFAAAGGFEIVGHVGFDALFQFDPLRVVTDFSAGLSLKAGGTPIMSIQLEGMLAGPTPWHLRGVARFEFPPGTKQAVEIDQRFGPADPPPLPQPVDVEPLVRAAFADARNWSSELPQAEHPLVSLRDVRGEEILAHPLATVTVRQRVVPLDRTISRFGNTVPRGARTFKVEVVAADGRPLPPVQTVTDAFALAQYETLSDDQKLTRPAFEQLPAGFRIGAAAMDYPSTLALADPVQYETFRYDPVLAPAAERSPSYALTSAVLDRIATSGAAGQSELGRTGRDRYAAR